MDYPFSPPPCSQGTPFRGACQALFTPSWNLASRSFFRIDTEAAPDLYCPSISSRSVARLAETPMILLLVPGALTDQW